jgi:hypothetical protein
MVFGVLIGRPLVVIRLCGLVLRHCVGNVLIISGLTVRCLRRIWIFGFGRRRFVRILMLI